MVKNDRSLRRERISAVTLNRTFKNHNIDGDNLVVYIRPIDKGQNSTMSYDSFKAGIDLDVLIGEKIFGVRYEFVHDDYMIPAPSIRLHTTSAPIIQRILPLPGKCLRNY